MGPAMVFDSAAFEQRLEAAVLEGLDPELEAAAVQITRAGGKRLRARLVYLFGAMCNGAEAPLTSLAIAVELLHAATLVHDDLIDRAPQRRGVGAVHVDHGQEVAILVGDLYVARCGTALAASGDSRATAEIFHALATMVRGELLQRRRRFDLRQTEADYEQTVDRKTASLLAAACAAAVAVSGGGEPEVEAARSYARHVGLAFQVIDDVLDYEGSEAEMGKPAGSDIAEGTVTLPLIYAQTMSPAPLVMIVESARQRGDFSAVIQGVRRSGALERCRQLAQRHTEEAVAALDAFPAGAEREALRALAEEIVDRRG